MLERRRDRSPVGNIYVGRVTRVLPGMQAAFIDIGLDRAAFLHVEDLLPPTDVDKVTEESKAGEDDDAAQRPNRLSRKTPIRDVIKEGQTIVVQVSKGPIGTKGARVTSHVALPGRYVVYMPTLEQVGVSKRIGNDKERSAVMVTRLSPSDASAYGLENTATPMYVGSLSILQRPRAGLSYESLLATVEKRLPPGGGLGGGS